jgi:hypothetical protein
MVTASHGGSHKITGAVCGGGSPVAPCNLNTTAGQGGRCSHKFLACVTHRNIHGAEICSGEVTGGSLESLPGAVTNGSLALGSVT